jgi:hypothetical protein
MNTGREASVRYKHRQATEPRQQFALPAERGQRFGGVVPQVLPGPSAWAALSDAGRIRR